MHLLDSNVIIEHLSGRFDLLAQLHRLGRSNCAIPTIAVYEICHGALKSRDAHQYPRVLAFMSGLEWLPLDGAAAQAAAQIRFDLERSGTVIGPYDLLIAAIALSHDCTLVTHNVREFSRVRGLRIEDWQAAAP